jgi:hypothetical protein
MEVKVILRLLIAAFTVLYLAPQTAVACSMQAAEAWENTPSRVRKNFDAAEFVVVATVVDVTMLKKAAAAFPDFMTNVEHARFRVDEVFKGKPKPGDIFEIDSGFSSCARGVTHPDRLYVWDKGKTRKVGYAIAITVSVSGAALALLALARIPIALILVFGAAAISIVTFLSGHLGILLP